jgi:hypothetical protein
MPVSLTELKTAVARLPDEELAAFARWFEAFLEAQSAASPSRQSPRRLSSAEIAARFKTDKPAPDDPTVRKWMDEQRMEKYG